ncbi:unnamed protein product [Caenorhabditis auriculariae]|uniref:PLD phosphodiesterase domain-containing protein n=1 Tax=Caenorhabditis auriculariae TaxID=2777116 RepID=A0A8S1H0N0_9PELO|nr:unnamed protein product [Caenorhabditis auriculariae]
MRFGPEIWSHSLAVTAAIMLTSGIWLTAYFAGVKNNKPQYNTYNYMTNVSACDSSAPKCQVPAIPQCDNTCEFVICESVPAGLQFDPKYKKFNSTTNCWMRLMEEAKKDILIGSYYWSLLVQDTGDGYTVDPTGTSADGKLIYDTIQSTAARGIDIRVAQAYEKGGYPETADLAKNSNGKIQVRSLDFTQWYPGGILHAKSWVVDGKHIYIGSANFDWRSLTQVKELGVAVFNCPCVGEDLQKLLEIYWTMGAPGAKLPQQWPDEFSTGANSKTPGSVPQPSGNQAVYISASPPGFQSCGREDDLAAMIKAIDGANEYINMAVMDYSPSTLYLKGNKLKIINFRWEPTLDTAIRRAAFERGIRIRFLLSRWPHTFKEFYAYMYSLQDISNTLPCISYANSSCQKKGSIEVRLIQVPAMQYGAIPYARVYHNKYFTTETTSYVGTSNWSPDYWDFTAGIGLVLRAEDVSLTSPIVADLNSIFERDWNSNYTIPLSFFDNSGNNVTHLDL